MHQDQVMAEKKKTLISPPLLPSISSPPRPSSKMAVVKSVTRKEIDRYWRRKKMEEEEHLLAAQKAAARIRAKALKEEDYRRFEELIREIIDGNESEKEEEGELCDNNKAVQIGIKDWWTKSKYAYLNQPAIKSMGDNAIKPTCTYIPQKPYLLFTSSVPITHYKSYGVF